MKFKPLFEKHTFGISLFVFTVAFIFSRIPFLICPFVEISYDSIEYSNFFDLYLSQGKLPPNDYIPLGYPFLIKSLSFLSSSVYSIVAFQMFVGYVGCLMIIYFTSKYYKPAYPLLVAIALSLFVLSTNNIYFDASVFSESLYNSSLLFITAFIIWALNSKSKKAWLFLSFTLAMPIMFRPNGVFALILFFLFIFHLFFNSRRMIGIFAIPFVSVLFLLSTYSYFANGDFSVVSSKRVRVNTKASPDKKVSETYSIWLERTLKHYNYFNNQEPYYYKIHALKKKYFDYNYVQGIDTGAAFFFPLNEEIKKRALKEFYDTANIAHLAIMDQRINQHWFFKSFFNVYQERIAGKLVTNCFWQWLMAASFLYAVFVYCKSRFRNDASFILLAMISINFGTNFIVIVSKAVRILPRYEYPAEFLFHLSAVFLVALILEKREHAQQ